MTTPPPAKAVPASLLEYDQWICWKHEERDGKQTKVPLDPSTGRFASTTDPTSWASFADARTIATSSDADGIGFVFTSDDPFVGVDLDHCRVAETETIHDWAQDIIDQLDSYTEVSPSRTGVHVLVRGSLPEGGNRRGNVELYETSRFFTVTGHHVAGTLREIHHRSDALSAVHQEHISISSAEQTPEPPAAQRAAGEALDDTALIKRAQRAANGQKFSDLWNGSTAGYESQSEADMALSSMLAFWTGGDATQVDRLFRESGLYRGKWDEIHFADGSTYGEKTVERAIAGTSEFYTPSNPNRESSEKNASPEEAQTQTIVALHQEIDLLTEKLAARRKTVEALESELRSLEATNTELREELKTVRASSGEDSESPPEKSFWQRLWP